MNYAIDAFVPPILATRPPATLNLTSRHADHLDNVIGGFNSQSSSQIDGLRHRRHERYGYYNGAADAEIAASTERLGTQDWARAGIAGGGILLDAEYGLGIDDPYQWHRSGPALVADDLESIVNAQGDRIRPGDIVVLHTG